MYFSSVSIVAVLAAASAVVGQYNFYERRSASPDHHDLLEARAEYLEARDHYLHTRSLYGMFLPKNPLPTHHHPRFKGRERKKNPHRTNLLNA